MARKLLVVIVVVGSLAGSAAATAGVSSPRAPRARAAFVHNCDPQRYYVRDRLVAVATVMSVRNMRCRSALRVIRRYGRSADGGRHFTLGPFACSRYYQNYEDNKARCVAGRHAFRVDYGS